MKKIFFSPVTRFIAFMGVNLCILLACANFIPELILKIPYFDFAKDLE